MWSTLSIRSQLIWIMLALLILVEAPTAAAIIWFDAQERQNIATEQARTLVRSLNNDLLKTIINPSIDNFTDLSFRVSGYRPVNVLRLLNDRDEAINEIKQADYDDAMMSHLTQLQLNVPSFQHKHLFLKVAIESEGQVFGYATMMVDPTQYDTQIESRLTVLVWLFPLELLIGFIFARRMSISFTKPFQVLAQAMQSNDMNKNQFITIKSSAQNEVQQLFDGYNQMIDKIEQTTEALRYQSRHDSLTGLFNRYAIEQALSGALHEAGEFEHQLLSIDLDRFKLVNDAYGHAAGDSLLKLLAQEMHVLLPFEAVLARVGGDDFMVLLSKTGREEGNFIAQQLLALLDDYRFVWQGQALSASGSIGMVSFKPNEYTLEALVKAADTAFYIAKSEGRNHLHHYQALDANTKQFDRDIQVAGYIKEALNNTGASRFELFAQAIVPLQTPSDEIGYEILIRLWDREGNLVPPNDFLPTAERYQLMIEIDRYVLWTYLSIAVQHPHHLAKLHMAHVNLSGSSLNHPDFQATLKKAISMFRFPWYKLALEITETSAVGNLTQAMDFIQYCQQIGISFALDDFGTGMSSFEYLKHLPFDVIKIDGSFIKDMHKDPLDLAVIRYIQEISLLRQQETVAEYVETAQDVAVLRQIGITYGQGYFLGKPKPLQEWLAADKV